MTILTYLYLVGTYKESFHSASSKREMRAGMSLTSAILRFYFRFDVLPMARFFSQIKEISGSWEAMIMKTWYNYDKLRLISHLKASTSRAAAI